MKIENQVCAPENDYPLKRLLNYWCKDLTILIKK